MSPLSNKRNDNHLWYKNAWCRGLYDTSITTASPEAYSRWDSKEFVSSIHDAGCDSLMFPVQDITGYTMYPSKVGVQHPALKGRNVFGEILSECHKRGMYLVGYMWAAGGGVLLYDMHPQWRVLKWNETPLIKPGSGSRACCLNNPDFRRYNLHLIKEVVSSYDVDGLFFDDPWFEEPCACGSCQELFLKDTGLEFPREISRDRLDDPVVLKYYVWNRKVWAKRHREIREVVKSYREDITVTFQFHTPPLGIQYGQSEDAAAAADFVGRDMWHSTHLENHSLACKTMRSYSPNIPSENHHRLVWGGNSTLTPKPLDYLKVHAAYALAHNAAVGWIDNLMLDGRLSPRHLKRLKEINNWMRKYINYVGGEEMADIGVYYSADSALIPITLFKRARMQWPFLPPFFTHMQVADGEHLQCTYGAVKFLVEANLPFDVITVRQLHKLKQFRVVILPAVEVMSERELKAFKGYVKDGGNLIVTGRTSLRGEDLVERDNFGLSNLIGGDYAGMTPQKVTYITPSDAARPLGLMLEMLDSGVPQWYEGSQPKISNVKGKILAYISTPLAEDLEDEVKRPILHMDSPEKKTDYPSIVVNDHGNGRTVYCGANITKLPFDEYGDLTIGLVNMLGQGEGWSWMSDAPNTVEVLFYHQKDKNRYVCHLINAPDRFPIIPIRDIQISLRLNGKLVKKVTEITHNQPLEPVVEEKYCKVTVPCLNDYSVVIFEL